MISGPGDTRRRPGGQQPAVDGADLEGAEEVAQVGRHGGEPAAVEGDDHRGQQDEERRAVVPDGGEQRSRR